MSDLEQIITDSVNDSINDVTPDETPETPTEAVEAAPEPAEAEQVEATPESDEVASPAKLEAPEAVPETPQDDFSKLVGMQQIGVGGRENRIPYSRVKKIVGKSVSDAEGVLAEAVLGRKLNSGEKALDAVKTYVAKVPELTTKVEDYEKRLANVGEFENVMANDPERFLRMLQTLPAYQGVFELLDLGYAAKQGQTQQPQTPAAVTPNPESDMPAPDEELPDGSKVYSLEGLKKLLSWNAEQVESRVTGNYEKQIKELRATYDPIANEWNERRRIDATLPIIKKQLEDAASWPLFKESEAEILDILSKDRKISLEGAYRQAVWPKLISERNKVRQEVLDEVRNAPAASSVPTRAGTKPVAQSAGPRSIEDIIKEQIDSIKK